MRKWVVIDACGGGCIRFRDNKSRRIVREGSGNLWFRCRGNNSSMIGRDGSVCWKKCGCDSSSGGCWNRRRVNMSRMISRGNIGRIGRYNSRLLSLSIEVLRL